MCVCFRRYRIGRKLVRDRSSKSRLTSTSITESQFADDDSDFIELSSPTAMGVPRSKVQGVSIRVCVCVCEREGGGEIGLPGTG